MKINSPVLNVTDIKQYLYCPRILYFTYVLPVEKKTTPKMKSGKEEHVVISGLEERRKLRAYGLAEGQRVFNTYLFSPRLGLQGVLDMYVSTPRGCFPVDFKSTHRLELTHKYQLIAYGLLLEEFFGSPVRGGFIYLISQKRTHYIEMTPESRLYIKRVLGAIRNLIAKEYFPPLCRHRRRCTDCEYKNYCGDVE